jgi:hypothetical protein
LIRVGVSEFAKLIDKVLSFYHRLRVRQLIR